MPRRLLFRLLLACLGMVPLAGQSFQSRFSEPTYDLAKGPKHAFGDVQVDAATGHTSMTLPLGPGIGTRGAVYQPVVTINRVYTHRLQENLLTADDTFPIRIPCSLIDGDYTIGSGKCADSVVYSDVVTNQSGTYLFPGTLDLAIPGLGYVNHDRLTRFQIGTLSGVVANSGLLPGATDSQSYGSVKPTDILAKFGYLSTVQVGVEAGWSDIPRSSFVHIASSRYLVMALRGGPFLDQNQPENRYSGGQSNAIPGTLVFPGAMLVVDGDTAYEFVYVLPKQEEAFYRVSDGSGNYLKQVRGTGHGHYRLKRILNAFGDEIRFTYTGTTVAASGSMPSYLVPKTIQAEWWRSTSGLPQSAAADTGVGITSSFVLASNSKASYTVAYSGLKDASGVSQALSYTLLVGDHSSGFSPHKAYVKTPDDPGTATGGTTTPAPLFDSATSPTCYPAMVQGDFAYVPVEGLWENIPMDAIRQDQTMERIDFQVSPSDLPPGNFALWSGVAEAAYSVDGHAPYRVVVLQWSPEYSYVDSSGPYMNLRRGRAYTVGVTQVDDIVAGPSAPVTRTTLYDRHVPVPYYTDWVQVSVNGYGLGTTPSTTGLVVFTDAGGNVLWQSTDFHTTVSHPDGTSVTFTYAPPDFSSVATRLAFLKTLPIKEEWKGSDGTTSKITTWSKFDLKALGDPNETQTAVAVPHAEHWETVDYLVGRKESHTLQRWSPADAAYAYEAITISGTGGSLPVDRSVTKTFDSKPGLFLMARVASESIPGFPLVSRTWMQNMDLVTDEKKGVEGGLQVKLHQDFRGGVLTKAWIGNGGDSSSTLGATYTADTLGFLNAIQPIDTTLAVLKTTRTSNGLGWPLVDADANGLTKTYAWDAQGTLTKVALPNGEAGVQYNFDHVKRQLSFTRSAAQATQVLYNGYGQRILERRKSSDGLWSSHRATGYDAGGRVAWQTVWRSGDGALVDWTQPLAPDDVNIPGTAAWTEVTDQCISWQRYPDGTSVCRAYKTIDHPAVPASTVYKASSHYSYDAHGRVTQTTSPNQENQAQEQVDTTYIGLENGYKKTTVVAQIRQTVDTFDARGRMVSVKDALGQVTTYGYDSGDRIITVTQKDAATGLTQTRGWRYDGLGRVIVLDQPESGVTYYTRIRPDGKAQKTVYGLRPGWTPSSPDLEDTSAELQPGVKVLNTIWDNVGRLKTLTSNDLSVNQSRVYGEAETGHGLANGKLVHATANGVERLLDYTGLNGRLSRLTRKIDGQSFVAGLGYDSLYGLLTSRTYPDTKVQKLDYDWAKALPKSSGFGASPTTSDLVAGMAWDTPAWGLTQITWANSASSSYVYRGDQVGLHAMTHTIPGPLNQTWTYNYNSAGDLLTDGEDSYSTDALGRLTEAWVRNAFGTDQHQSFSYDAFGNRTSTTSMAVTNWTAGQQAVPSNPAQSTSTVLTVQNVDFRPASVPTGQSRPELTSLGSTNRLPAMTATGVPTGALYDGMGNLTRIYRKPTSVNPSTLTMSYDALARVTSLSDALNATSQTYTYDDEGLRIKKVDSKTGVTTYNIYNEARQLVATYTKTGSGSLTWKKDIVYVGTKEVAEIDATGTEITLVDHLGSPRFAWRGGTTPVIKQKFLPFGEALTDPTSASKFAKGFTNHEQTDASGLIYMQARFYAPRYGRFLSPDPARDQHFEETQSWNIYSYCQNDPTMHTDPTGMFWKELGAYAAGFGSRLASPFVASYNSFKSKAAFKQAAVSALAFGLSPTRAAVQGAQARVSEVKSEFKAASTASNYTHALGGVAADVFSLAAPSAKGLGLPGGSGSAIGFHATMPEAADSILSGGFRLGSQPGRLGSFGVYVNDTPGGAAAEFGHHNPGVTPSILEVKYQPGTNASAGVSPQNYVMEHPLNVDSISAPSVRAPGTTNTNILNGSAEPIRKVQ